MAIWVANLFATKLLKQKLRSTRPGVFDSSNLENKWGAFFFFFLKKKIFSGTRIQSDLLGVCSEPFA